MCLIKYSNEEEFRLHTNTFSDLQRYVEISLVVGHHEQIANQLILRIDGSLLVANSATRLHQLKYNMQQDVL